MLCLASVRRWQLLHGGLPKSVEVALKDAKVDPAQVVDPYTGHAFKIMGSAKCAVYSLGPDQLDDQGKVKVEYTYSKPKIMGDIVFDIAEAAIE